MSRPTDPDLGDAEELVRRAMAGDEAALAALFERHRPRLRRLVRLRLDRRLRGRLDASDVLQEAFIDLVRRLPEYGRAPHLPFFLWLRLELGHRLAKIHRMHLGAAMRDADLEVSLFGGGLPAASTDILADRLAGQFTSIGERAIRAETRAKVRAALEAMEPADREVLAMRHFEELANAEAALVLQISEAASSKRYVRALRRLREALRGVPGLFD